MNQSGLTGVHPSTILLDLFQARRVAPTETLIIYNLALILRKLGNQILRDDKSNLSLVLAAVHELTLAHKYFQYLCVNGDKNKYDLHLCAHEARQCQDLLSQAQYHVARARKVDEEDRIMRKKQEEERQAFRIKQMEEQVSFFLHLQVYQLICTHVHN